MAQFGKHLFGTSYFGKTSTFDGEYMIEPIDAGELFTEKIHVAITAELPNMTYSADSLDLVFPEKTQWTFTGKQARTTQTGSVIQLLACGSRYAFNFKQETGGGRIQATFKHIQSEDETVFTLDTSVDEQLIVDKDYADFLVTIKTLDNKPVTFLNATIDVSNIGAEVRTATVLTEEGHQWGEWLPVPLAYNDARTQLVGDSQTIQNQQYVQVRFHLATSDSQAAPILDKADISGGDITKYAENGYWYAAINFNNEAKDQGVTFKRVKRLEWKELETEHSALDIRSTSINSNNSTTVPTLTEVPDNSYWKPETARYRVRRDRGGVYGEPWSRVSLGEAENGFTQSNTNASVLIGPVTPSRSGMTNTQLMQWLSWDDLSDYPTDKQGTSITYEWYKNKQDPQRGISPIHIVEQPEKIQSRILTITPEEFSEEIYLRIVLRRTSGRQSPVVDYVDSVAQLKYRSPASLGSYIDTLSGLDNVLESKTEDDLGRRHLRDISYTLFDWPSLTQELAANAESLRSNPRVYSMSYNPKYNGQVHIGFDSDLKEQLVFPSTSTPTYALHSKVSVDEPSASTREVPRNRLYWHYNYDGGTVNFPRITERDLSTDFTPNLLSEKKYRFYLINGWPQETFQLPYTMTWDEAAEMVGYSVERLKQENTNVKLYNGKINQGNQLLLPNDSQNDLIKLAFQETNQLTSEYSTWNKVNNDTVLAQIPNGGTYQYIDWVSDEVLYNGVINTNDEASAYARTQLASFEARPESQYTVIEESEDIASIAQTHNVAIEDVKEINNGKTLFYKDEKVLIPKSFVLPEIAPGVIYDGDHPYRIEIIPDSVKRTADDLLLPEDTLISGSDDEPGIQYTLVESSVRTVDITRGTIPHGKDVLPYSNVVRIESIKDKSTGTVYTPYVQNGDSQMGDFILKDDSIDWSPAHSSGKEPAKGAIYTVTLTHGVVDTLKIIYTSDYKEKAAYDKLWRSVEVKELSGIVTPEKDLYLDLPTKQQFSDFKPYYSDVEYIVEDNDVWVKTSIQDIDGVPKLYATLNGEDPKRNWYPTVQTGFYYLHDKEHYLYSEPVEYTYGEEAVPIIEDVTYSEKGMSLM